MIDLSIQNDTEEELEITSELKIKLRIISENFEILTEGTLKNLSKDIQDLMLFTQKITEEFEPVSIEIEEEDVEKTDIASAAEIPAISISSSTPETLRALYRTSWGRSPRSVSDVRYALQVNAFYVNMASLQTALNRLVKSGTLRRLRIEGKWKYFAVPGNE